MNGNVVIGHNNLLQTAWWCLVAWITLRSLTLTDVPVNVVEDEP